MKKKTRSNDKQSESPVENFLIKEITYTCPVRGKVTEKIKVKIIKAQPTPEQVHSLDLPFLQEDEDDGI